MNIPTQILDADSVTGVQISGGAVKPASPVPGCPGPYSLQLANGELVPLIDGAHGPAVMVCDRETHLGAGVLEKIEKAREALAANSDWRGGPLKFADA